MMYTPKHFIIQELVPPEVYRERGERAWEILDPKMLMTIDAMRERFGPMIINTWHSTRLIGGYGMRKHSGLRTMSYFVDMHGEKAGREKYLSSFSQHKYGRGFDAVFRDYKAEEVRKHVLASPGAFPYLTAIEDDVSWFHGDVRNTQGIKVFKP